MSLCFLSPTFAYAWMEVSGMKSVDIILDSMFHSGKSHWLSLVLLTHPQRHETRALQKESGSCCDGFQLTELHDMHWNGHYKVFRRSAPTISLYAFDWHYQPHVPHSFDLRYGAAVSFFILVVPSSFICNTAPMSCYWLGPAFSFRSWSKLACSGIIFSCQVVAWCQLGFRSTMIGRRWLQCRSAQVSHPTGSQAYISARSQLSAWNERQPTESTTPDHMLISPNGFCATLRWNPPARSSSKSCFSAALHAWWSKGFRCKLFLLV